MNLSEWCILYSFFQMGHVFPLARSEKENLHEEKDFNLQGKRIDPAASLKALENMNFEKMLILQSDGKVENLLYWVHAI